MRSQVDHRLLVCHQNGKALAEALSKRLPELKIEWANQPEEALRFIEDVDIILSSAKQITDDLLRKAKNLVWFASISAGNDKLAWNPNLPESVILTKAISHGESMAEYVFAHLLYFNARIANHLECQKNRVWDRSLPGVFPTRLGGQTMGLLGLGWVGRVIAKRGKQFGMTVLGLKRTPEPVENVDKVFGPEDLDTMIPLLDCLIVVLPLTRETHHFLGERELRLMKEGAVLISMGRGKEIDEEGLVKVLQTKRIRAVLDVFETEPLPRESKLWDLENVIITPHISGLTTPAEICEEFIANYERWSRGEPPVGVVDREKGY
jgi:phosphoglycerate dehydrogenase-like enzyme